jgi:glucosylceramidase
MTRLFSIPNSALLSLTSCGLVLAAVACSSGSTPDNKGSGGTGAVGGTSGGSAGKPAGTGGSTGGTGGSTGGTGGSTGGGTATGGTGGSAGGTGGGGTAGVGVTGGTGGSIAAGGTGGSAGGTPAVGGSAGIGTGGTVSAGAGGMSGSAGSAGSGGTPVNLPPLVTSASGAYWQTSGTLTESTMTATVTVNDTSVAQTWDGFGGAFNELGWSFLTTTDLQNQAMKLLFSATDGANFAWGRIPIGASDYATSRYTCDDMGADPAATSDGSNRPAADTAMANFTIARDGMKLIPYIKAAQAVNPGLRFWASPWTPPVWMKTGYKTDNGSGGTVVKPSYYDGGNIVTNSAANLTAYATYYTKFVQGYGAQNINIEIVSPQNEPGYDQNYPSCLWDKATYVSWVGTYLGPAMKALNVKVMLGTLSNAGDNNRSDLDISTAVLADATAKTFVSVVGAQWGVLDKVNSGTTFMGLPVWATEHKCGNYPWNPSGYPAYNSTQAPNDQAYGVESWGYIRDAITKGKVTSYSAWNMVLDKKGLGIDTSRDWKQDALLVVDSGMVNPTPAYYVFRHFSQYVAPKATVVGTTGGDAVAFKNPDGSLVAVMFNSGAANANYVVAIGGKKYQFAMPANGWATVMYKPS